MGENLGSSVHEETPIKESPQLVALLKEMKVGLDAVRSKVQALTVKIRPIDKKLQYQIQKLTRFVGNAVESVSTDGRKSSASQETEDLLKYRPNPDMLASKLDHANQDGEGVYRPPKFATTAMDEDKISKREKQALRKEKEALWQAKQSAYVKELIDDFEGRPEEVREIIGTESRELLRYQSKMEERAQREEELFTRAPLSKIEKKKEKHLKKSRNGLLGLTDGFYDEIKTLPLEEDAPEQMDYIDTIRERKKSNKCKRKH